MNRNIIFRQFRYFISVAETASVASASRMLNIAQSAITKSILELEETAEAHPRARPLTFLP